MKKKIIFIILGFIIFNSCKSNNELDGYWITNGKLIFIDKNISKYTTCCNKKTSEGKLTFLKNRIFYQAYYHSIEFSNLDSLITKSPLGQDVFKKVPDNLRKKSDKLINLKNKSFFSK